MENPSPYKIFKTGDINFFASFK